jgi:putative DNA primase/helicase
LATCEPIQEWLFFTQNGDADRVQLLRAWLKAVVTGRSDLQRLLELIGPGGAGKSTYANLAIALVGLANVHSTDLETLQKDKFELCNIYGKRLVYLADAERYAGGVGKLKAITGGDPVRFEQKYQKAQASFTFDGMVVLVANESIVSSDYTSGLERRRLTVPFLRAVDLSSQRTLLDTKNGEITGEFVQYLPGLLNWVLEMPDAEVTRLVKNTAVSVPSLNQAKKETLLKTNSIAEWFDAECVFAPGVQIQVGDARRVRRIDGAVSFDEYQNAETWLYPAYRTYCDRSNIKPIALMRFGNLLLDLCNNQLKNSEVLQTKAPNNKSVFVGVALRGVGYQNSPCPISKPIPVVTPAATPIEPVAETPAVEIQPIDRVEETPPTAPPTQRQQPPAPRYRTPDGNDVEVLKRFGSGLIHARVRNSAGFESQVNFADLVELNSLVAA